MKAIHVSWTILLTAFGSLLTALGLSISSGNIDWNAIGASILAIIASFSPSILPSSSVVVKKDV